MPAELNHTIVWCSDKRRSSAFLTDILGRPEAKPFYNFLVVELDNGVSLDFYEKEGPVARQHYAFLISEPDFDAVLDRIEAQGLAYWADPAQRVAGRFNRHDGGRGLYFEDPDGHLLEVITRPYGSGS